MKRHDLVRILAVLVIGAVLLVGLWIKGDIEVGGKGSGMEFYFRAREPEARPTESPSGGTERVPDVAVSDEP